MASVICAAGVFTTPRFEVSSSQYKLRVDVGEPAYANRRLIGTVLLFVGQEVLSSTIQEGVGRAFDAAEERLNPSDNSYSVYFGSHFVEPNNGFHFFGSAQNEWFVYNFASQGWEPISPPNMIVYRVNDVFQTSSGQLTSVSVY